MKLSLENLQYLAPGTKVPTYPRNQLKTRMVHVGFGVFHRAHQAVYADQLAEQFGSDWGFCEVNLIGGEQQIVDLNAQDHLFSVAEMASTGWSSRVVGVVQRAIHGEIEGINAVLEAMAEPDIAIVSITITEKGYCYQPSTGKLAESHPLIQHDIAHPQTPKSAPGLIVEALRLRRERHLPAFTVMSCDNMPENGHVASNVILGLARMQSEELAQWIETHVSFPSTMVDRIVPAVTPETLDKITHKLGGIIDPVGVACEPFRQWVIEDNFVNGRPEWEKVGAELVQDVLPFEEMKLRMLNGSHSFLAYLGYLAGYAHINDCMQDDNYVAAARYLMLKEQAPTLRTQGVDLVAYADSLIERYHNTALKHRTWQIAMDGTQKLPQRMLDSVRYHLKHNSNFDCLALGIAGWMRYVGGIDEQGQPIEVSDPNLTQLQSLVNASQEGPERVNALLSLDLVFGNELPKNQKFVDCVTQAYMHLISYGARQSVAKLVQGF